MKNTGIVRRLDELGRIVIPREFRKTFRINIGDPLEINATDDGKIIISKVDHTSDLLHICESAASTLSDELGLTIAASNFEHFICAYGQGRQAFIERIVNSQVLKLIKNRGFYYGSTSSDEVGKLSDTSFSHIVIASITGIDDCFGGLFAFSSSAISESDVMSVRLAAKLIGSALQKY